jgi:hypothetical protein
MAEVQAQQLRRIGRFEPFELFERPASSVCSFRGNHYAEMEGLLTQWVLNHPRSTLNRSDVISVRSLTDIHDSYYHIQDCTTEVYETESCTHLVITNTNQVNRTQALKVLEEVFA